jgi:hypothetical protein
MFGRRKKGPTHEDALQASRQVMKYALTHKMLYGDSPTVARWAADVLEREHAAYEAGVRRAVD